MTAAYRDYRCFRVEVPPSSFYGFSRPRSSSPAHSCYTSPLVFEETASGSNDVGIRGLAVPLSETNRFSTSPGNPQAFYNATSTIDGNVNPTDPNVRRPVNQIYFDVVNPFDFDTMGANDNDFETIYSTYVATPATIGAGGWSFVEASNPGGTSTITVSISDDTVVDLENQLQLIGFVANPIVGESLLFNNVSYKINSFTKSASVISFETTDDISDLVGAVGGGATTLTVKFSYKDQPYGYYDKNKDRINDIDLIEMWQRMEQSLPDYKIELNNGSFIDDPYKRKQIRIYNITKNSEFILPVEPNWAPSPGPARVLPSLIDDAAATSSEYGWSEENSQGKPSGILNVLEDFLSANIEADDEIYILDFETNDNVSSCRPAAYDALKADPEWVASNPSFRYSAFEIPGVRQALNNEYVALGFRDMPKYRNLKAFFFDDYQSSWTNTASGKYKIDDNDSLAIRFATRINGIQVFSEMTGLDGTEIFLEFGDTVVGPMTAEMTQTNTAYTTLRSPSLTSEITAAIETWGLNGGGIYFISSALTSSQAEDHVVDFVSAVNLLSDTTLPNTDSLQVDAHRWEAIDEIENVVSPTFPFIPENVVHYKDWGSGLQTYMLNNFLENGRTREGLGEELFLQFYNPTLYYRSDPGTERNTDHPIVPIGGVDLLYPVVDLYDQANAPARFKAIWLDEVEFDVFEAGEFPNPECGSGGGNGGGGGSERPNNGMLYPRGDIC